VPAKSVAASRLDRAPAVLAGLSILALGAALWFFSPAVSSQERESPKRDAAPRIEFQDAQGRPTTIGAFAGKVVLLDFWASWCLPCQREMPLFDHLQEKLGSRGFVVVPVSIDAHGLEAVSGFYAGQNIRRLEKFTDPSREAAKRLGFVGIPSALILDRQGRIAARIEGPINWESSRIAALFDRLLSEK
jgi:thiol-disulfide isomerase/thioredoxin